MHHHLMRKFPQNTFFFIHAECLRKQASLNWPGVGWRIGDEEDAVKTCPTLCRQLSAESRPVVSCLQRDNLQHDKRERERLGGKQTQLITNPDSYLYSRREIQGRPGSAVGKTSNLL